MRIAIIGGGVAAFEAATAARKQDETAEIAVHSREKVPPYRRPALSGMVAHELDDARFFIKGEAFFAQERIALHLDSEAVKLCFVLKGFPPFPVHLRMRPVSRGYLRHSLVCPPGHRT